MKTRQKIRIRGRHSGYCKNRKDLRYVCYALDTNVTGYGATPREAYEDFQWWSRCFV